MKSFFKGTFEVFAFAAATYTFLAVIVVVADIVKGCNTAEGNSRSPGTAAGSSREGHDPAADSRKLEEEVSLHWELIDRSDVVARVEESDRLATAMCAYLQREGGAETECVRRDLPGLAYLLVEVADERHREGHWIPLSREKAPAFLAAVAYREVSWQWVRAPEGGLGERCAFQLGSGAIRHTGVTRRVVDRDPEFCVTAAINWMSLGAETCGAGRPHAWMSWYATRGRCDGGRRVRQIVGQRFETARALLRLMEEEPL